MRESGSKLQADKGRETPYDEKECIIIINSRIKIIEPVSCGINFLHIEPLFDNQKRDIMDIIINNLKHSLTITVFVFIMMIFIDYLELLTRGRMSRLIKGGLFRQYVMSSFLGSTPGCLGSFLNVSFYMRGLISFGAITGGMIAASGDEAFVMLAMFPEKAVLLFGILFITGIICAYIVDRLAPFFKINPKQECAVTVLHSVEDCRILGIKDIISHLKHITFIRFLLLSCLGAILLFIIKDAGADGGWDWKRITFLNLISLSIYIVISVPDHYLNEHIWDHIARRHIWRVFLWTFGALLLVDTLFGSMDAGEFMRHNMIFVLLMACVIGIIPESGPHLIIVTMFAKGLIPFSVLLASSIVQDGHGMLPLLSFSVKDSIIIKIINFIIGLGAGLILYSFGY
ncbi:MAG: putative manganese transporter [Spirochaetes bacterium]|nr:putative manganese transporter [Spirochaetota bacterium]